MITIDARWLNASGIGTYLRNIIPGILENFPTQEFAILGEPSGISQLLGAGNANVRLINAASPMYSIREQLDYVRLIPKETTLYFATHYNVPLFYRGKMLVTVYDLFHLAMPDLVGGLHKQLYARLMFNAVRHKATAITTISNFSRLELIRFTGQGKQPIVPIYLGVTKDWFSIPQSGSPHRRPYIVYVGNIKPHKNLAALVRAFDSVADRIPHDLILVGKKEGFITGDSSVAIEAKGLEERVHFTGRVDDALLRRYFSYADALVFPSLYEGFGLPPLEAMAASCPILVSNAGPMPEICGDAALYCDPYRIDDIADKMLMLLNDAPLRDALRQRGLERARNFTWDRCIRETCNVMREVLNQPGKGVS